MMKKKDVRPLPENIHTPEGTIYKRGQYLGKGGFARCYEFIDKDKNVYAGKAVAKSLLMKPSNKEKMSMEIEIHRSVVHQNIVKMHRFFEDNDFVYMVLELCSNRSMMEMQKRRGFVTEPEARYFVSQIVSAVQYIHGQLIIHRDLKLGNIFINEQMQVKVGDFGLATRLQNRDERKDTLCGTPNYIAPEMLQRKKHSFEVDIWAIGCILYTLICGRPPFETNCIQETYTRIKQNIYNFPSVVGVYCSEVIRRMLHPDPSKRPRIGEILAYKFFTHGYTPRELPRSCLSIAPKLNSSLLGGGICESRLLNTALAEKRDLVIPEQHVKANPVNQPVTEEKSFVLTELQTNGNRNKALAQLLEDQLTRLLSVVGENTENHNAIDLFSENPDPEAESPSLTPNYYVTKWVDYSDKYGLGYQLADGSIGVIFNDSSKITLDRAMQRITYTERHGYEKYFAVNNYPTYMHKKMLLLNYFIDYMRNQLLVASNHRHEHSDAIARSPFLINWFRSRVAIVLALSNGVIQINFFDDHVKFILCPMVQALSIIDDDRTLHTYSFDTLAKHGCSKGMNGRLKYCKTVLERLIARLESSAPSPPVAHTPPPL